MPSDGVLVGCCAGRAWRQGLRRSLPLRRLRSAALCDGQAQPIVSSVTVASSDDGRRRRATIPQADRLRRPPWRRTAGGLNRSFFLRPRTLALWPTYRRRASNDPILHLVEAEAGGTQRRGDFAIERMREGDHDRFFALIAQAGFARESAPTQRRPLLDLSLVTGTGSL